VLPVTLRSAQELRGLLVLAVGGGEREQRALDAVGMLRLEPLGNESF